MINKMKTFANDKNISNLVSDSLREKYEVDKLSTYNARPPKSATNVMGQSKGSYFRSNVFERYTKSERFKKIKDNLPYIPDYAKDVSRYDDGGLGAQTSLGLHQTQQAQMLEQLLNPQPTKPE